MSLHVVTADLGNSRLKLRAWLPEDPGGGLPRCVGALELAGTADELATGTRAWLESQRHGTRAWLESGAHGTRAVLVSVAAPSTTDRVAEALGEVCAELVRDPDPGLEVRVREPERVGPDRLLAAAGALAELGSDCVVVDAGTALTVDAVQVAPGSAGPRGVFLGGAIAPGPRLLAEALASGAARLPRVEPRPGVRALGRTTEEAIAAGCVVGFRGAAAELVRRIAAETELEGAPVVLTGGARAFLLEPEPFLAAPELLVREDLVHLGLLAALGAE